MQGPPDACRHEELLLIPIAHLQDAPHRSHIYECILPAQITFWKKKCYDAFFFPPSLAKSSKDSKGLSLQRAKKGGSWGAVATTARRR